ncbi:hypothetical protein LCGC14_2914400, partial [marine sediment metagenome]
FVLHPEYWGKTTHDLRLESQDDEKYHIASQEFNRQNRLFVYHEDWLIHDRAKYRLHSSEVKDGLEPGDELPRTVPIRDKRVLILICYEVLFPEDYLLQNKGNVDLVLHMIGEPMFNEDQREGWIAMQQAISIMYQCPVICCCGGKKGRMNITGITERSPK